MLWNLNNSASALHQALESIASSSDDHASEIERNGVALRGVFVKRVRSFELIRDHLVHL